MKAKSVSRLIAIAILCTSTLSLTSCSDLWKEQHPGTYYTFSGYTIASELERRSEDFSEFIEVLQRANVWGELQTYGYNTCFAPYNSAIDTFLVQRGIKNRGRAYESVSELPKEDCDTLAWTHLVEGMTCFVGEMEQGLFPKLNRNDRYLMLSFDSVLYKIDEVNNDTAYTLIRSVNKYSHIKERDDTCENGVIHTIDKCIDFTGNYVYDLIDNNPHTQIFSQALKLAGFENVKINNKENPYFLGQYYDLNYKIGSDSTDDKSKVILQASTRKYTLIYEEKKRTCFTVFIETDSVFKKHNINNLDDLIQYAKDVYDPIYPNSADITDPKDPNNSLHRFLAYHILPFSAGHDNFNTRRNKISYFNAGITDPEDYFTTLAPHTLMRISTDFVKDKKIGNVYINKMGSEGTGSLVFAGTKIPGIKILTGEEMDKVNNVPVEQIALNGMIHYIDDILVYDKQVSDVVLKRRLRIDCGTLSPDFITSGARAAYKGKAANGENSSIGFRDLKNFTFLNSDYRIHLRPVEESTNTYEGDAVDIEGLFDIYVKLPPVPCDGTWQLRISFRALDPSDMGGKDVCGVVQYFLAEVAPNEEITYDKWEPLGLPIDMRVKLTNSNVGWIADSELEDEDAIDALDKAMRNRGWMKGPDSQLTQNQGSKQGGHRGESHQGRCIVSTDYMYTNMDYYLRFRQLLDKSDAQFCFDYIELVPKEVYDNHEDKH